MTVDVLFRDIVTGEQRTYHDDYDWPDDGEGMLFQYLENNYSCDCNRELFFRRSAGEDPEVMSTQCSGETNRYVIDEIRDHATGRTLYKP